RHAQDHSEHRAGVHVRSASGAARFHHLLRGFQEFGEVQAHAGAGHHAEIRECGVTPSDAGNSRENMAEMVRFGDLLQLRTGISDGDEVAAHFIGTHLGFNSFKKILLENVGLQCAARFTGHDAQRLAQIQLPLQRFDLAGVGGIQHMQFRKAGNFPEGQAQHFGAQAGAAHAQQQNVAELGLPYFLRQLPEGSEIRDLLLRDVKPAEPVALVRAAPERSILLPEARDLVVVFPVRKRNVNCRGQGWRQFVSQFVEAHARTPALFPVASSNCLNASAKSFTPSRSNLSVTSFMEMPAWPRLSIVFTAPATSSVRLLRNLPWSRKASKVAGGMVSTVSAPMSSST